MTTLRVRCPDAEPEARLLGRIIRSAVIAISSNNLRYREEGLDLFRRRGRKGSVFVRSCRFIAKVYGVEDSYVLEHYQRLFERKGIESLIRLAMAKRDGL